MSLISCLRMPALILLMNSPSKTSINLLWEHSFLEGAGFALSQDLDFCENSFSRVLARKRSFILLCIHLIKCCFYQRKKYSDYRDIDEFKMTRQSPHWQDFGPSLWTVFFKRYAYELYSNKFPWMNKRWLTRRSHWNHQPAFLRGKYCLVK